MMKKQLLEIIRQDFDTHNLPESETKLSGAKVFMAEAKESLRAGSNGTCVYYNIQEIGYWKVSKAMSHLFAMAGYGVKKLVKSAIDQGLGRLQTESTVMITKSVGTASQPASLIIHIHRIQSWMGTTVSIELLFATDEMSAYPLSLPAVIEPTKPLPDEDHMFPWLPRS